MTLAMVALHPERVKCAIVHEVPFDTPPNFLELRKQNEGVIVQTCQNFFRNMFIEGANDGKAKWDALGPEYHKRLEKNFVMWQHNVVSTWESQSRILATPENLTRRPVFWTVGALSSRDVWASDWELGEAAGLKINNRALNCMHFAYVTVPEETVKWIVQCLGEDKA